MTTIVEGQQAGVKAVRRLIEEGFSGGNVDVVDEVCAEELVEHQDGFDPRNREGVKRGIAFLHRLAPDVKVTIEDLAVDGDKVWLRARARGTHTGELLGGPTGRSFDICVMDVCRLSQGRIVEHWGVPDRFAQLQQIGLLPTPGGPPDRNRSAAGGSES